MLSSQNALDPGIWSSLQILHRVSLHDVWVESSPVRHAVPWINLLQEIPCPMVAGYWALHPTAWGWRAKTWWPWATWACSEGRSPFCQSVFLPANETGGRRELFLPSLSDSLPYPTPITPLWDLLQMTLAGAHQAEGEIIKKPLQVSSRAPACESTASSTEGWGAAEREWDRGMWGRETTQNLVCSSAISVPPQNDLCLYENFRLIFFFSFFLFFAQVSNMFSGLNWVGGRGGLGRAQTLSFTV